MAIFNIRYMLKIRRGLTRRNPISICTEIQRGAMALNFETQISLNILRIMNDCVYELLSLLLTNFSGAKFSPISKYVIRFFLTFIEQILILLFSL